MTKLKHLEVELEETEYIKERYERQSVSQRIQKNIDELKGTPEADQEVYLKDDKMKFYRRAEKASVIGDTVGDPLKDTSGPSLNILIKLSSIISVIFGTLFVNTSYLNI
jgi:hypothetical protein